MTQRTRSANLGGTIITSTGVVLASGLDVSNQSNAAYQQANTARNTANSAFNHANNAFDHANSAFAHANTIFDRANAAYLQANTARSDANTTFATVNSTFGTVNTAITNAHNQANTARSDANTTFATVNTTFSTVNSTFGTVNTAITNAHNQANSAFAAANLRLSTSGGSISGDLAITGNLTVTGNATTINVSNLSVNDSMILLSTNAIGDSNDIGFIGHFDRGATATHAGLIRKATQNQFYLFDNYEVEPTNNVIDVTGNNFRVGNLRLGIINANSFVTSAGLNVTDQANSAFAAANNRVLKAGDTMTGQLNISSGGLLVTGTAQATYFYGLAAGTNDSANFGNSQSNLRIGGNGSHVTLNAAPWGFNLVAGSGSGNTALYVNTSGSVGVGTSSPEGLLHVKSTSAYPAFLFEAANTAIYAGPYLNLRNPSLSTNFGETSIQHTLLDPNDLTNVVFQIQQRTTSSSFVRQILVYDYKNQNWSFLTNGSERLKIDSSGNTSIGTSSTPVRLCVQTSGNGNLDGIQVKSPSGHFMDFRPAAAQGGNNGLVSANDQAIIFSGTAVNTGNLVIAPWATSTGGLKITSNGFIGVGTTTPNGAFHIATTNNVAPILKLETTGNSTNTAFWIEDQDANVAARAIATMDLSAGLGLFNLYAGAYTVAATNYYGSARGATRIGMHDNTFNFFTANASGAGQSTGTAVTWYQTLAMSNSSFIVYTNNGTERLRVSETGNVGIGAITTPSTILALPTTTSRLSWGTPAGAYALGSSGGGGLLFGVNGDSEYFAIETHLSGTGHAERFRITEAGNVGIGITNPGRKLDVEGGGRFVQDTAATTGAITLRQNSGDTVSAFIQWVNNAANSERGWMTMDTSSNFILATASAEKLRVTSGGNVGVGTSSPATKLHVAGSTRIDHTVGGSSLENGNGLQINGAYTNGQYSHRLRKWDDGGGVPLYVQFTEGTANTWSNLAKFGPNSADSSSFTVYGTARAYRASGDNMGVQILGGDTNNSYLRVQNSTGSVDYGQGNGSTFVNVNNNQGWYVSTGGSARFEITGAGAVNIRGTSFASEVIYGNNGMGALDTASNMNTLNQKSGFYLYNNPTNGPFGTWTTWLQLTGHYVTDNYGWQLAKNYWGNDWRIRSLTNNSWGSWLGLVLYGNNTSAGDVYATRFYDSDDTNVYLDSGALVLRSNAPTIYFRDTDHNSAMLHNNGSLLYVLRGGNDTTSWSQVNGQWPFIFYLNNNDALCGGAFSAVGNVTAYASDRRLKTNIQKIPNALDKVLSLNGVTFDWIDRVKELGFTPDTMINDAGVIAQEVQEVLPQAVKPAPFDREWDNDKNEYVSKSGEDFITVQYEKLVPLLIEAIKELKAEIETLKQRG